MAVVDRVPGVVERAAAGELVVDGTCMASRFPVTLAHCHHTAIWILHCPHTADAAVPVGMLSPPLWVGCCSGLKFLELLL